MAFVVTLSVSESEVPANRKVTVTMTITNSGTSAVSITAIGYSVVGSANQGVTWPSPQFFPQVPAISGSTPGVAYMTWEDRFFASTGSGLPAQATLGCTVTTSDGSNTGTSNAPVVNVYSDGFYTPWSFMQTNLAVNNLTYMQPSTLGPPPVP